jgi:hypothetical protein
MRLSATCQGLNSLNDNVSVQPSAISYQQKPGLIILYQHRLESLCHQIPSHSQSAGYCLQPLTFDHRHDTKRAGYLFMQADNDSPYTVIYKNQRNEA